MRAFLETLRSFWTKFWFRPASPLGLIAVRALLAGNALWIVLSRPGLPSLVNWPPEFWARVDRQLAIRYLIMHLPAGAETALFLLLNVSLAFAMIGVLPRLSCLLSGLLLYHFAPFENIIWHAMGPYFSGLTLPTLGLIVLGVAQIPHFDSEWSPEYRWPLALVQLILSFNYAFAAISKMRTVGGFGWVSAENLRGMALTSMTWETPPPLAAWVASSPAACWTIAAVTMVVECLFILVPFSKIAAGILVPLALIGHLGIIMVLGIVFLSLPCLLIYLDWDAIATKVGRPRAPMIHRA